MPRSSKLKEFREKITNQIKLAVVVRDQKAAELAQAEAQVQALQNVLALADDTPPTAKESKR